ncbi:MAG TPA: carbohydrate-binding family 9-like protein [bacterium]|nr:carbohydrate-binding family 9-like protein [bacterium]HOL35006.1 carbohydrate-binding family 9-like protein [bacterium]HPP07983.1 carbohydrate-binding family 9-like protein [bacterium]
MIKNQKIFLLFLLCFSYSCSICWSADDYNCYKIQERVVIDGKLQETSWKNARELIFRDMVNGSPASLKTTAKMMWDDNYFYVGFECEDPDVWARVSLKDSEVPENLVFRITRKKEVTPSEWYRFEAEIMNLDKFVKVFIDPDADQSNYMEFHINPINNVFDAWYPHGLQDITKETWESPHVRWSCAGMISAVYIDGTLNAPHDVDRGWSVEIAFPWKSVKFLTKGSCPPKSGDIWSVLLCRLHRPGFWIQKSKEYWSWPVVGKLNCHILSTYGKVKFCDDTKKFLKLFASGSGNPEQVLSQAKEIGVTDFVAAGDEETIKKYIEAGKKNSINIYAMIYLNNPELWKKKYPGIDVPLQRMTEEENNLKEYFKDKDNRVSSGYQMGESPRQRNREVLYIDLLCFHDERVRNLFKEEIDRLVKIKGLSGIMFDFFGYQNYYGCFCNESTKQFERYLAQHKEMEKGKAFEQFSLETLISVYQELIDYIKTKDKTLKTIAHIYPVFLPEPFYGSRTGLDYWAQTIAWYFPRDIAEMGDNTRKMMEDEKKYYVSTSGVGMIGYYNRPDAYPYKSAERVEMELKTMLDNGCQYVFVYSLNDVLRTSDVKEVFRKYFKK